MVATLLFLQSLEASAQGRAVAFKETFDDNGRVWFTGSTDNGDLDAEIKGGQFILQMNGNKGWRYLSTETKLNNTMNWTLKFRIRQESGATDNPYGFVYNTGDAQNMFVFSITSEGKARVVRLKEGDESDLVEEADVSSIHGQGQWNTLEIRKVNDALSFWVNDSYVGGYSASWYRIPGNDLGPFVQWEQTIEVDEITLEEWSMDPIDVVQGADAGAVPRNLGPTINTEADELVDAIAPDGSMLMFSRQGFSGNVGDPDMRDIYFSIPNEDGSWKPAVNPRSPLNSSGHDFGVAVAQDLNTIYVQGLYYPDGSSRDGGVSYSHRTTTGWSTPEPMEITNYYNHSSFSNSHVSPDGSVLILSVWRDDTRGGNDLHVCFRTPDNKWTEPKNLGNVINTVGTETGPFIAADGKTMYFASNGHPGYEGQDIFVTVRQDDSWLKWSKPRNLGRPINSDENDAFFQVPASGDSGYFSSQKNAIGENDVYSIALPPAARPEAVILARGRVLDIETREPVQAQIVYETLAEGKKVGTARSAPSDGSYRVSLVHGQQYSVRAEANGYYPLSEALDARGLTDYSEQVKDLLLTPIKKNIAIRLNNVFFDVGKYDLRPESYPELDRLAEFLKQNAAMKIEIAGHTDNVGSDDANRVLSQNRANSVASYVVSRGIAESRIVSKGYGEVKPVASNDSDDGRQMNRRVEFTIVE